MRHIANLSPEKVPRDEEFKFKQRAQALVDRWQLLAHSNSPSKKATSEGVNGEAMMVDGKNNPASDTNQEPGQGPDVAMEEA
jgi:hypothetical protein